MPKPLVVQDTTLMDGRSTVGGFNAICGLIEIETKSPLQNDVYSVLVELAPGKYRGIHAESILMATPDTSAATAVIETATDTSKLITVFEHIKQNNIAYLVGLFVSHQLGILDQVIVWGSSTGLC